MQSIPSIEKNNLVNIEPAHTMDARVMEAATVDTKSAPRRIRELPRKEVSVTVLSSAELVECTCPDFCDRDHDRD
jgi:AMMECR1 domain-containing protein